MSRETILQVVESGVRWSNNIINELLGNYAKHIPEQARAHLKQASVELADCFHELRKL